jgi:2'-5' RNA ligase
MRIASCRVSGGGEITGIVVMAPVAEPFQAHAHITLLAPFGDAARFDGSLVEDLAAWFATVEPFDVALTAVREFADGVAYLSPEPADRFRALTEALAVRFPDYPPYEGVFADIVPHCTIDAGARGAAARMLPLQFRATEAQLVHADGDARWRTVARFPFTPA